MRDTPTRRARLRVVFFPALLGPAHLLLFGMFATYSRNAGEFAASFWSLAAVWLWVLVAIVGVLVAIGLLLPARVLPGYVSILFAIGVLLWVQGNLLGADYGPLYGGGLDLTRDAWRTPLELALWAGALAMAAYFSRRVSRVASLASQALIAVQTIALMAQAISGPYKAETDAPSTTARWSSPPERIYRLSHEQNVIHIVLDGFLSEIFGEIAGRERAAFDRDFSGFVFFADQLGAFRSTRASMPAMFTGLAYRNEEPFGRFRSGLARKPSIFTVLARKGYRLHSISAHHSDLAPASIRRGVLRYWIPTPYANRATYVRFAAAQLFDLTLFRHVPHLLKSRVYNDDAWLVQNWFGPAARRATASNHLAFFDEFTRTMTVGFDKPVYLYMHVLAPHPPVVLDAGCGFIGQQPLTRTTYAAQAHCALSVVQRFLARLRELGIYDRSVILVTSDHGWNLERADHPLHGVSSPAGPLDRVSAGAMPLLLVKAAGASGPLRTSYAPTALTDIPATILDLAGLPTDSMPGQSVFAIDPVAPRRRTYAFHSWTNADWKRPYYDALLLFSVNGRVLDPASWTFDRVIFDPTSDIEAELGQRQIGLSTVQDGDDGPFRWGRPYVVTYAPPDARLFTVAARKPTHVAGPLLVTVRIDGQAVVRQQLTDHSWHTLQQRLDSHDRGGSPFCVELVAEAPASGGDADGRTAVQYRGPDWSR